jgi:hypothetical protein
MGSQLDIAGSFILAGMMLLAFNMFIVDKQQAELTSTNQVIRQESMASTTSLMMFDIRKAGYRSTSTPILISKAHTLAFTGDIDNNGSVDTVRYDCRKATTTTGVEKILLFRTYNGIASAGADLDITHLHYTYLDKDGTVTTIPGDVKTIVASIDFREHVRNPGDVAAIRTTDFRITPRNL